MDTTTKLCSVCHKKTVRYHLSYNNKTRCRCGYRMITKGKMELCSTRCPELYWEVSEYLTPKNANYIKVVVLVEDECNGCGHGIYYDMILEGIKV